MKAEKLTKFYKTEEADRKWFVIDADGLILGRLATKVARIIRGKEKAIFTPNTDTGDFVIIINAEKIKIAVKRETQKTYFRHSGYPGGEKITKYQVMKVKKPEFIIEHAVRGMLPKTKLGNKLIKKLKVYSGSNHPHQAQQPETLSVH